MSEDERPTAPARGALVLDFQGPFVPVPELITGHFGPSFAVVRLFRNPDVAIYISSDEDADVLIEALTKARKMRQEANPGECQ